MFLFEKSLIGTYCNRLYGLKKGMVPFHAMTDKANSTGKNLNVTYYNQKKECH